MASDYSKGKIYLLKSSYTDKVYIGSTINELDVRISEHKSKYKKWLQDNTMDYCTSYEILKFADATIELLENYPCASKKKLERYEGKKQRELIGKGLVNLIIAGRTRKEYREDNKEHIKKSKKDYYEKNLDKIKEHYKEYYQDNKEKLKQKYEDIKEDYNKKRREIIKCECGCEMNKSSLLKHTKSKKHLELMSIKTIE